MPDNPCEDARTVLHNTQPIDEADPRWEPLLRNLQGNILKGHGRDFGVYIFFRFEGDATTGKTDLAGLASEYVTSAYRQYEERELRRRFGIPGGLFGSLLLSADGLRFLNYDPHLMREATYDSVRSNFAEGLKAHAVEDFADPPPERWEEPYRHEIHGLLILADDDENHLLREARRAIQSLQRRHRVVGVELGRALRDAQGNGIEHFGFSDGRSQPLYLASDFQYDAEGKRIGERGGGRIDLWDPFEPLHRILRPEHLINCEANCYGSFMVYRKLQQDVRGFRKREEQLADLLALKGEERKRAAAMVMGRFRDGTPLALSPVCGHGAESENNFTYRNLGGGRNDQHGLRCPIQAHVRKVNPRGDFFPHSTGAGPGERQHRIARRSIPYGKQPQSAGAEADPSALPSSDVGVLFMCFQANIPIQFAFLQKKWCNVASRQTSPADHRITGTDPVVGQADPNAPAAAWPLQYDEPATATFAFQDFVHMKGGEFFYAPSIPFLMKLKP